MLIITTVGLINEICTKTKAVAITFDDGPNPMYTSRLLDIFASVKGKATFFMLGEQMRKSPEMVKRVAKAGHEIGNHTYSHPDLTKVTNEQAYNELHDNETLINELTGKKPLVFRPPYLAYNQTTLEIAERFGYRTIGAVNLEAKDWDQPGVEHILTATRKIIKEGSILIFHDGFGDRSETMTAVEKLVGELVEEGYQLVTVSELIEQQII